MTEGKSDTDAICGLEPGFFPEDNREPWKDVKWGGDMMGFVLEMWQKAK